MSHARILKQIWETQDNENQKKYPKSVKLNAFDPKVTTIFVIFEHKKKVQSARKEV